MHTVYLALGSNVGERDGHIIEAIRALSSDPNVDVIKVSSVYETDPVGYTDQPQFLNMVICISTTLTPNQLLQLTQKVENENGRIRDVRWGPRTLDLDILLFDRENIETEYLTIPHPRMMERNFVMVPLLEVVNDTMKMYLQSFDINTSVEGMRVWRASQQLTF
ncbi:2-amino-4-hydroxy-6-hydroxymethyldihydropteridine diphosphokinase [Bacillus solimangrovi]